MTPPEPQTPRDITRELHEHRWQALGVHFEGWLAWIAQSCECGATRQVRTER